MRLAFMGTPDFAVPVLNELLAAGHHVAAVYTRPPALAGRGKALTPSPVHRFAEAHGIEARTPKNFKSEETRAAFAALDLDAAIVAAYGLILPQIILEAPRFGCLNLHASLLPRWRGAVPIQRAIMAGDAVTGVQVMRMEAGLDEGPVLLSEAVEIRADDTGGALHDRLAQTAAQLAPRALAALARGSLIATPQSAEGVLYAPKIAPGETRIDWSRPAKEIDRHIRGLSPAPGAWFEADGARVRALFSRVAAGKGAPGEILSANEGFIVACGAGAIELVTLQRAGKRAQEAAEFLRGFQLRAGDRLA